MIIYLCYIFNTIERYVIIADIKCGIIIWKLFSHLDEKIEPFQIVYFVQNF